MLETIYALALIALAAATAFNHKKLARRQERLAAQVRSVQRSALAALRAGRQREAKALLAAADRPPRHAVEFRSSEGEDLFLWDLFDGRLDGSYIEVGAFNGRDHSVTWVFDAVGWHGVLIEPLPDRFEECRANRPNAHVVHAALSRKGSDGTTTFTVLTRDGTSRPHSFLTDSPEHARRHKKSIARSQHVTVPLTTMTRVLDASPLTGTIDFAVIDVEGGELDLLDGFDLDKHPVRVLLIEELTAGEDRSLREHMRGRGYGFICRVGRNDLYVRHGEDALADRARQLAHLV